MTKTITLTVQQFGEQLAVVIPADIVQGMRLAAGQSITLGISNSPAEFPSVDELVPTLEQMLARYDPEKFNGEVLADLPVGREIIK